MRKTLNFAIEFAALFLILDLLILFTALGQIAVEGRTGYWNGFWRWQAEKVVQLISSVEAK